MGEWMLSCMPAFFKINSWKLEFYELDRVNLIFQQDNDPKHTSHQASKWFKQNNINVLKWPAQSPDLNPIEHLWYHLKWQLNAYEHPPAGMHELWEQVQMEWDKIPKEVCRNLIESMPRRIEAVIKAKGAQTKYWQQNRSIECTIL
jgi:hypothetical protein